MGKELNAQVKSCFSDILRKIVQLLRSFILDDNSHRLVFTHLVWNACDVVKSLPMSNIEAVDRKWKSIIEVFEDVLSEMDQMMNEDFDEDVEWSPESQQVIRNARQIVLTCKQIFTKIQKRCLTDCDWLEDTDEIKNKFGILLDIFGSSLYAPQDIDLICRHGLSLIQEIQAIVELAKCQCESSHIAWFDMAIDCCNKSLASLSSRNPSR